MRTRTLTAVALTAVAFAACGDPEHWRVTEPRESDGSSGTEQVTKKPPVVDSGAFPVAKATATVKGRVVFQGEVPRLRKEPIAGDDYCLKCFAESGPPPKSEFMIDGATKGVQWAFVYVMEGDNWKFEVPKEHVKLDQHNCTYHPPTLGIMVGQTLEVHNSDGTEHNIHLFAKRNKGLNRSQAKGDVEKVSFKRAEDAKFKCDIHGWMRSNIHIMKHPLFAVTDEKGEFTLPKLPAGEYTIAVKHHKWKSVSTQKVTVADNGEATVELGLKK